MKKIYFLIFILFNISCKKVKEDENIPITPDSPDLKITLKYFAGSQPLQFDTIQYLNAAGNNYSVSTLNFYLSRLKLIKPDSQEVSVKDWIYVDAKNAGTNSVIVKDVPQGDYIGMKFNIGLDSILNQTGGLPNTSENLQMEWPVPMGGGYHFLKMEGHWLDSGNLLGYALHLGTCIGLKSVIISGNFCIGSSCQPVFLNVDVNEWFRNPYTFDLNTDGNYTMGNDSAMYKITQNGWDVFYLQ